MAWTYSGNPANSPLDEVRFLIGDTDPNKQQLQDDEILYNITLVSGVSPPATGNFLAAAYCADILVANNARSVDKSVGDLSISHGQQVKNYQELAKALRRRATFRSVQVFAGGMSRAAKQENYNDLDQTQAAIKIDGMNKIVNENDSTETP